ncbi:DUF167 domain-containing protein [bacterium]|nr:MAG: DUF167 domain-containing protein [bacterium]
MAAARHSQKWKKRLLGVKNGLILVAVRAAPADGEANAAVIQTLSAFFGCSKSNLTLVRGHKSREKTVRLAGINAAQVSEKLR